MIYRIKSGRPCAFTDDFTQAEQLAAMARSSVSPTFIKGLRDGHYVYVRTQGHWVADYASGYELVQEHEQDVEVL